MRHKFQHLDVIRTIIPFGGCFCAESIAGGVLRGEETISKAISVREALEMFSTCSHNVMASGSGIILDDISICLDCCSILNEAGNIADDTVPSVSRLCFALADCANYGSVSG